MTDGRVPEGRAFRKILVVDDIFYVVKSIVRILEAEGYFLLTATSGKEALEKAAKFSPDLITVDQKLPDMSGIQLVERLDALNPDKRPKIVFISSVYEREEVTAILKHRVDDYLLKPFKKDQLVSVVKRLL